MGGKQDNPEPRRKGKGSTKQEKVTWLGFVEISLTEEDKAAIVDMPLNDKAAFDFIEGMVEDGYKVSFSEDTAHSSFIASATGQRPGNPNAGYTLAGRGPSVIGSLASLAYKHQQLCKQGDWTAFVGSTTTSKWG